MYRFAFLSHQYAIAREAKVLSAFISYIRETWLKQKKF